MTAEWPDPAAAAAAVAHHAGADSPPDLFAFARDFFQTHNAGAVEADGRLHISLTEALAAHFGREHLVLAFNPHDEGGELVAPGSRVFDQIATYLAGRGRMAALRRPASCFDDPAPEALAGLLTTAAPADAPRRFVLYDFLLAFLTDERAERLWTIALDDRGRPAPAALAWAATAEDAGATTAGALDPQTSRHGAEIAARSEAERVGKSIEAAASTRLARICARLTEYYEALIEEVPVRRRKGRPEEAGLAEADTERSALAADLARRLGEEARRHQLRIQVRLLGQATLEAPGRRHTWRLAAGPRAEDRARIVEAWQDLATGAVSWPACDRCGDATHRFGLCTDGHLACATCLAWCNACGQAHCSAELTACDACGTQGCARCLGPCAGAGRSPHRVCRTHLAGCACCGIAYCDGCRPACPRPGGGGGA